MLGFNKATACEDLNASLRAALHKGWEWQDTCPIFVFSGDIEKFFDNCRPRRVAEACDELKFPPGLTAAILQENVGLQAHIQFQGQAESSMAPYTRCVATGSVEGPLCSKLLLLAVVLRLLPSWEERGLPAAFAEGAIQRALTVWVDNLYLLANSEHALKTMVRELTQGLTAMELRWKPGSLMYLHSKPGVPPVCPLTVGSPREQLTVKGMKEMPSLGELLDSGGTSRCSVRYRLIKATVHFNILLGEGLLVGKLEHVLPRFRDFYSRVVPIATLGCGGWAWCRGVHDVIQGWESRMLRRICPAPRVEGEDVGVYLQRSVR